MTSMAVLHCNFSNHKVIEKCQLMSSSCLLASFFEPIHHNFVPGFYPAWPDEIGNDFDKSDS